MDTSEKVLIGFSIFAGIGVVVLIFGLYSLSKKLDAANLAAGIVPGPGALGALAAPLAAFGEPIKQFLITLFQYSPTALFSYGFVNSIIFQSFDALIPNAFALLGLTLNTFGVRFFPPPPPDPAAPAYAGNPDFCYISGMPFFDFGVLPPSIILVTTILWHYLLLEWLSGSASATIAPSATLGFLLVTHTIMILRNCELDGFTLTRVFFAFLAGIGFGSASMATVKYGLNKGGSSVGPGGLLGSKKGGGLGSGPTTPGVGTCSAPNDQDQFVCEAYRNGELITTTIAE
jgi:hypothetical protein